MPLLGEGAQVGRDTSRKGLVEPGLGPTDRDHDAVQAHAAPEQAVALAQPLWEQRLHAVAVHAAFPAQARLRASQAGIVGIPAAALADDLLEQQRVLEGRRT